MNILELIKYCSESKEKVLIFKPNNPGIYHLYYGFESLFTYDVNNFEYLTKLDSGHIIDLYESGITFEVYDYEQTE